MQIEFVQQAASISTPSAASRSMWGVLFTRLP